MSSPGYIPFPQLSGPFTYEDRTITPEWHRLLVALWNLAGASQIPIAQAVYFIYDPLDQLVRAYGVDPSVGLLGPLLIATQRGGAAEPQTLTTSPFTFAPTTSGSFICDSGQLEISRDGGTTFYSAGLTGGSIHARRADVLRVSWTQTAPVVVWLPDV